jgi:hypothetical protein
MEAMGTFLRFYFKDDIFIIIPFVLVCNTKNKKEGSGTALKGHPISA